MNCERVDDLLPAYALDAIDTEERAAIEAHLGNCDQHEEVAALRAVSRALADLAPEREPSPALEGRLLEAAEAAERHRVAHPPRSARRALGWPVLAAALAALVVVLAGWNLMLRSDTGAQLVQVYREGEAWMRVEAEPSSSAVTVALGGLERRPDSEVFQVWAVRDGSWLTIGTCNTNPEGRWLGDFAFSLEGNDHVAVTIEPAGGSARPTGTRVFALPQ
jgi:anti-sigma-K factor RskA